MKHAKKLWALVLALVMVLALGVTAWAADDTMDFEVLYLGKNGGENDYKLAGGVFVLKEGTTVKYTSEPSGEDGLAKFTGVEEGTYTLELKTAPVGYEKAKCIDKMSTEEYEETSTVTVTKTTETAGGVTLDKIHAKFTLASGDGYQWNGGKGNNIYREPSFRSEYTMTKITIPFTKVVKLGGNAAPGSQKFELKITPAVDVNVKTTAVVNTTGAGSYNGTITIEGAKSQVVNLVARGFAVEEVNDGAANWTYSDAKYNVVKTGQDRWDGTGTLTFAYYPVVNGNQSGEAVAEMTFENTYTQNVTYTRPTQPTETKIGSPKTFDAGIGLYAVSALLSVTGGAWLVGKKHK